MRSNIVLLLEPKLKNLNSSERILATKIILDHRYNLLERYREIFVKTPEGNLFPFIEFIKKTCNCGN